MDEPHRTAGSRMAGRKDIITGAESGVGKAVAELFRAEGGSLALMDLNEAELKQVAETLDSAPIPVDLADTDRQGTAAHEAADGATSVC